MPVIKKTDEFSEWLDGLKDAKARFRIAARILQAEDGNFGDVKALGDDVSEMRIDVGPGYRVYFTRRGKVGYLLLCGGDKSTQGQDIKRAKATVADLED